MAAACGDKENQPPATSPAAVARFHGVGVKKGKLKRVGRARRRAPLRDITNLFVVEPVAAELLALRRPGLGENKVEPAVQKNAQLADGAAAMVGRYSLRKEFR